MNFFVIESEVSNRLLGYLNRLTSVSAQYTPREMLLCLMIRITNPIVIVVDEIAIVNIYFGLPDRKNPVRKRRILAVNLASGRHCELTEPETSGA